MLSAKGTLTYSAYREQENRDQGAVCQGDSHILTHTNGESERDTLCAALLPFNAESRSHIADVTKQSDINRRCLYAVGPLPLHCRGRGEGAVCQGPRTYSARMHTVVRVVSARGLAHTQLACNRSLGISLLSLFTHAPDVGQLALLFTWFSHGRIAQVCCDSIACNRMVE